MKTDRSEMMFFQSRDRQGAISRNALPDVRSLTVAALIVHARQFRLSGSDLA
ncbi:MAG: hypothetical protein L0241_20810 [Planctomycetia bacterium]|nr:hypothetical protein [Planctomycetia bacterium]